MPIVAAAAPIVLMAAAGPGGVAAFSFLGATGWGGVALAAASSMILSYASAALGPKQSKTKLPTLSLPNFAQEGRTTMVRQATAPRRLVFAETRVSGPILFSHVTGGSNEFLHLVVGLASHQIDSVVQIYMDGEPLQIGLDQANHASDSYVVGGYRSDHIRIKTHLGSDSQSADSDLISAVGNTSIWSSDHTLSGIAYLYIRLKFDRKIFPNGIPNFSALIRGKRVVDSRDSSTAWSSNPALCIRDYLMDTTFGLGATAAEIDDTSFNAAANTCDESVALNNSSEHEIGRLEGALIGNMVGDSSNSLAEGLGAAFDGQSGSNKPFAMIRSTHSGTGWPNATIGKHWGRSRIVTGYEIEAGDSNGFVNTSANFTIKLQGSNNGTSWSDLDTHTQSGAGGAQTLSRRGLSITTAYKYHRLHLAAPANEVRIVECRFYETGGTEARYTLAGIVETTDKPKDILAQMLTSCGGRLVYSGGKFKLIVAGYATPTVTLDDDDLRAGLEISPKITRRELANAVHGVFVNPAANYQPTDYAPVQQATDFDNYERIIKQVDYQFTQSHATAQRLATMELKRARQQVSVRAPCKLTAFQVEVGDTINFTNARMGWTNKTFEVIDWSLAHEDQGGAAALGVDLVLRETESAVFDWTPTDDETIYDPPAETSLPDARHPAPPTGLSITETIYVTRDGAGVKTRADLTWIAALDQFTGDYEIEYKLSSASTYDVSGRVPGTATTHTILDLAPGTYDFRVRSKNVIGVASDYTSVTVEIAGLSAAPSVLTNVSLEIPVTSVALLRWDQSTDLDVKIGGRISVRHSTATSGASWSNSVLLDDAVPGHATSVLLPAKPGTYLLRAIDSSGVQGTVATVSPSADLSLFAITGVVTVTESTGFAGTHATTYVDSNKLKLGGTTLIDSVSDFDAITDLDTAGGIASTGTYTFAATTDISSVQTVRLTTSVTVAIENLLDQIDDRSGNIDTWEDFDGGDAAPGNVEVFEKHSDDNVTYTDFARFDRTTVSGRYFQFKAVLTSSDVAYQPQVSALSVTIDKAA